MSNVRSLRDRLSWTQDNLAERSGFSKGYIAQLETGHTWVSAEAVTALALALGVSESVLFQEDTAILQPTPKQALEMVAKAMGIDIKVQKPRAEKPVG